MRGALFEHVAAGVVLGRDRSSRCLYVCNLSKFAGFADRHRFYCALQSPAFTEIDLAQIAADLDAREVSSTSPSDQLQLMCLTLGIIYRHFDCSAKLWV